MSFGFSVGDFLTALTLAKDLAIALSETRGAPAELRRLQTRLESLQNAINNSVQTVKEWDSAHPNPNNKAPFNALVEEHKICKALLENFWKDSEKYTQSLLNGKGSKVKREWAKIKWCMFRSDEAVVLERNLSLHVTAIDMYSSELRCRILKDNIDSNSAALAFVGRNVGENTVTLKDILLVMQHSDNLQQFSTQNPSAGLFPPDAPLKLFDAIGRELLVPSYLAGSFAIFHGFLELIFKDQRGYAKIMQHEYNLADEDSEGALITADEWAKLIKPGMTISLSMILRNSSAPDRACPRCNIQCIGPELAGHRLRCQLCQLTFRISDEVRIVELPESRQLSQQKAKTRVPGPSESPLRDEDFFQRIHIIRELTTTNRPFPRSRYVPSGRVTWQSRVPTPPGTKMNIRAKEIIEHVDRLFSAAGRESTSKDRCN